MVDIYEWCSQMMGGAYGGGWAYSILFLILFIGLIVLVYVWIWKLLKKK
ncbi:hypothetical protein J4457_07160 [Candidatus Woesearchaeota archaeon]|nr:hypothetical protein [Candidatus Woesearchaeota archaeon]